VDFETRYPPGWFFDPDVDSPKMIPSRVPLIETWQAMVELKKSGLAKEIGISNFNTALIRDLLNQTDEPPAVLQVELHPYLTQEKLIRFCQESEIAVTGFSPLGAQSYFQLDMAEASESVLDQDIVKSLAKELGKTPAQVVLRWGIQRGVSIVPKTSNRNRLVENIAIFDFELSDEQMQSMSDLNRHRRFNDPGDFCESAFHTFFPIYD
ncbi:MAG: aldo/keto reductase, partial [Planctomycetota bacterium]